MGGGGLYGTAGDYLRFARMILRAAPSTARRCCGPRRWP